MSTLLEAVAAALIKWLGGWLQGRQAARANAAATLNRDAALRDSQARRDKAEQAVEQSHAQTDTAVDQLHADAVAGGTDQLRRESDDVQRAIDAANGGVR